MTVPSLGRADLVLVDGRTFAISDDAGQIVGGTHGLVCDDLRYLSRLVLRIDGAELEVLAAEPATPFSAVVVGRVRHAAQGTAVITRRRWVAGGLRDDLHVHNTTPRSQEWCLRLELGADFAHVFDVKQGLASVPGTLVADADGWRIDAPDGSAAVRVCTDPVAQHPAPNVLEWRLSVAPRSEVVVTLTAAPADDAHAAPMLFPLGTTPREALPMRRLEAWNAGVARVTSKDPRLATAVDRALADIAALRIVDVAHPDRPVVAAGAPWFMTLFGRDSLLTAWMTLPFDHQLAVGVLRTLADLRGRTDDPVAEEQPGKILHELRRTGGGGPFADRQRYYGTVDATPLFVMLAAEAHRWGALPAGAYAELAEAVGAAVAWILGPGDSNGDGFVDYQRRNPRGLSNQGWKDSWDGVTFCDGSMPDGPIALAEVQGYAYAALLGAAELAAVMPLDVDPDELRERAARLRTAFNERFWDPRGWFAEALDGEGRRVDSLTTNPGHALWTGIAEPELATIQLDRFTEPAMWTGWGLRTLADTMDAYDPLSYHNGSVWPHDTAVCAAGAARYGRWDVVDLIADGALDAAMQFGGRPPELFAGISRDEAPMPVAYPSSCSPQAWASASVLLLVRTMLGLEPARDEVRATRPDLTNTPDLLIERVQVGDRRVDVEVRDGHFASRPRPDDAADLG